MNARRAYLGLGIVTAATVFVEIVLTRIFSVTLFYHFAFVAISLAMLGMAGGAMFVYLRRDTFPVEHSLSAMSRLTVYCAASTLGAYVLALGVGFQPIPHPVALMSLTLIVGLWAVPFFLSGMVVSLALTRSPFPVGRLYAADLVGAGLGCLMVHPALSTCGPPGSLACAAIALLCAAWVMRPAVARTGEEGRGWYQITAAGVAGFLLMSILAPDWVSPKLIKGRWESRPERVFWNGYSRVAVFPPTQSGPSQGWGMGRNFRASEFPAVTSRWENIDANAATWVTKFDGDLEKHEYVAYDVVNAVYQIRPQGSVAVVGVGGGRDVLSALVLGDHKVTGIELNPTFIRLLQRDHADFSGNIASHPNVRLVSAEARNWLERHNTRFDVVQISLIDTWAATASGAYCLSENTLYTTEAWATFLRRLTPSGVLTVSRWSGEVYRLAALAERALSATGQDEPQRCVAILSSPPSSGAELGVTTMLLSRSPFSDQECARLEEAATRYGWEMVYSPTLPRSPYLDLLTPASSLQWQQDYFLDISAPTDDRPFFFHMLRFPSLLSLGAHYTMVERSATLQMASWNLAATLILGFLGIALVIGALGLTVLPLRARQGRGVWRSSDRSLMLYFIGIGTGFMMVEMATIQRTGIILGHPVYGLQVTLFSLLVGSGLGSLLTSVLPDRSPGRVRFYLLSVPLATGLTVLALAPVASHLSGASQLARIATVASMVLVVGLFMGTPFPLGLELARSGGREPLLPWLWGVNGVFSVVGGFAATAGGLFLGARATGLLGVACYVLAWGAIWCHVRARSAATETPQTRQIGACERAAG